jgi:histidyl-tRNA synthetase
MSAKALPGFRDFYPDDLAFRAYLFDTFRTVARRYGFEEYDGPPLEPLELYTAKSGEEIVGQLYNFVDKADRAVALRPEMTPTLARMVAARANGLRKPIRWFSIPQLFRYERQQRGRLREHFQLNCDLIGEPGPAADAEIIALAIDVVRALGLGAAEVRVRLSDRRLLNAILGGLGIAGDAWPLVYQYLDKSGRGEDARLREALAAGGIAAATMDLLADLRRPATWAGLEAAHPEAAKAAPAVREVLAALEAAGLAEFVDIDLTIVRGLAYYTGTVFELFDSGRTLRAICGGGRYDNLLEAVGGADLPAVGFGMGDVVLGELLKERGLAPPVPPAIDLLVAAAREEDRPAVVALAHRLRDAGWRVEYALGEQNLGKQLKLADARGARAVLILGADERARGTVTLKDLAAGTQHEVGAEALAGELGTRLGSPSAAHRSPLTAHRSRTHG